LKIGPRGSSRTRTFLEDNNTGNFQSQSHKIILIFSRSLASLALGIRVRVDIKEQEVGGVGRPLGVGSMERNFLNFQVQMHDFVHFYCENIYLWPETGNMDGDLISTHGAKDVKRTAIYFMVENLAKDPALAPSSISSLVGIILSSVGPSVRPFVHPSVFYAVHCGAQGRSRG